MSQGDNMVLATNAIIETQVAEKYIRIIVIIIQKTTIDSTTQRKQC